MLRLLSVLYALVLLAIGLGGLTSSAYGQVSASLSGRIMDPTGAAISTARVTATNTETGVSRTALTNQSGSYQLLELPIGRYELHATKAGFAEEMRKGVF